MFVDELDIIHYISFTMWHDFFFSDLVEDWLRNHGIDTSDLYIKIKTKILQIVYDRRELETPLYKSVRRSPSSRPIHS